ncbi:MAG: alpha/beta fold hydrolase [Hyphomonadaceae bacterium]
MALQTLRAFLHVAIKKPTPPEAFELAMGWTMIVDHRVRSHLVSRNDDFTLELKMLKRPVLVSYGADDTVVTPAMAKTIGESAPHARLSEYAGVAHAPFLEDAGRFNAELAAFAAAVRH